MGDQYQAGLPNPSVSPEHLDQNYAYNSHSSPDAPTSEQHDPSRRMSALNLGFLKNLTEKRSSRDGAQPKKRGPKPDSKPALTRRQELNRQAQRTHRERKEQYVKALEDEVVRLKEIYSSISQDKAKLAEENKKLKDLLLQHGIALHSNPSDDHGAGGGGYHDGDQHNASGSGNSLPHGPNSQTGFSPGMASHTTGGSMSSAGPPSNQYTTGQQLRDLTRQVTTEKGVDYNQAGIDFVLTLERPCMNHLPYLLDKIHGGERPSGHALMASCPPQPFSKLGADSLFSTECIKDKSDTGQGTYNLSSVDLASLMDLSARISLEGEITPIMAWGMIMSHPKFKEMKPSDLRALAEQLGPRMRCFGYGAVTEEFEVRDAIAGLFSSGPEVEASA